MDHPSRGPTNQMIGSLSITSREGAHVTSSQVVDFRGGISVQIGPRLDVEVVSQEEEMTEATEQDFHGNRPNGDTADQPQRRSERVPVNTKQFYSSAPRQKVKNNRILSDDEEEDEIVLRSQRPRRIKLIPAQYEIDLGAENEDDLQTRGRKRRSRESRQADSGSDIWSESASEDESSDEDSGRWNRKNKNSEIRRVSGERKSERIPKGGSETKGDITDNEFEKMLQRKEKEIPKHKQKKIQKVQKKKKKSGLKNVRKIPLNDEEGNHDVCEVCKDGGEILLCDKCPRSYHKECSKIEVVPEGDWECPRCTGEMSESEESDSGHEHQCRVCRNSGEVLLCDYCPYVYHMTCLNPLMNELPEGLWKCPRCVILEKPLRGWVQSIITWKWSNHGENFDELDHTRSPMKKKTEQLKRELAAQNGGDNVDQKKPERLLFVRFRDFSYWECDWITESQLEVFHPTKFTHFKRKFDQEEPPALEDGSSFGEIRHHGSSKNDDPYKLEDRFYKWGIRPSWLRIHRILNHDRVGDREIYFVKWQDLGYEYSTWEDPEKVTLGLEDFDKFIEEYWKRRNERTKEESKKGRTLKPKKSLLKQKHEVQPSYIDETGGKLHPYQLEGLNWLRFSFSQDTNTILADEMGLGKTIQAISLLYVLWKEGYSKGPFLVSAPLSTVPNWEREFQFWAPDMYVLSYSGGKETRPIIRQHEFSYKPGALSTKTAGVFSRRHTPKFDVLLTSYEMVSTDKTTLASIDWDVMVIDEAHRLRSNQSLFFKTLCDYRVNYKLLLTGTPLQNNLEELFNLLNFLEPGKFNDMDNFLEVFSEISKEDQVQRLHDMLAPHMLRRMKADVLKDIPPKSEFLVRVELAPMQKKFYKHILTKNFQALNVKGYGKPTSLMNIMMDLRKCCNHPYLFPTAEKDAPLIKSGQYEVNALTKSCGKLDLLEKMLKILKEGNHRVLIFSQMTRVLDILEDFMSGLGYGYERIDGSIMGKVRQSAIDRFNSKDSDSFVFLLSTKAGGLGINLATADTVIIFDMDWNPHNDIQALSRAHRIGQKNKVMIYRFVSRSTVEERMAQVCKQKMMLTELVIHRKLGSEISDSLTKQELDDILKFGAEELFKDSGQAKAIVYDDEAVRKLLDRSQESEVVEEQAREFGLNEYLRSFKVASYQVNEGAGAEEVQEENQKDLVTPEKDGNYWNRVLGDSFEDHRAQLLKQQEELEASLGKGKRIRRKINYAEKFMTPEKAKTPKQKSPTGANDPEFEDAEDDEYRPDSATETCTGSDFTDEENVNLDMDGDGNDVGKVGQDQPLGIGISADKLDNKLNEDGLPIKKKRRRKAKKDQPPNTNPSDVKTDGSPTGLTNSSLELPTPPKLFENNSKSSDAPSPSIVEILLGNSDTFSDNSDVPIAQIAARQKQKKALKKRYDEISHSELRRRADKLAMHYPHMSRIMIYLKLEENKNCVQRTLKVLAAMENEFMKATNDSQAQVIPGSPQAEVKPNSVLDLDEIASLDDLPSPPKRKKTNDKNNSPKNQLEKSRPTATKGSSALQNLLSEIDEIDKELETLEQDNPDLGERYHHQKMNEVDQEIEGTSGVLTEMAIYKNKDATNTTPTGVKKDIKSNLKQSSSTSKENMATVKTGDLSKSPKPIPEKLETPWSKEELAVLMNWFLEEVKGKGVHATVENLGLCQIKNPCLMGRTICQLQSKIKQFKKSERVKTTKMVKKIVCPCGKC